MGDMLRKAYEDMPEKKQPKNMILCYMQMAILLITLTAVILVFANMIKESYWIGYEEGVVATEECLNNYGTMKADYEEHFMCLK